MASPITAAPNSMRAATMALDLPFCLGTMSPQVVHAYLSPLLDIQHLSTSDCQS